MALRERQVSTKATATSRKYRSYHSDSILYPHLSRSLSEEARRFSRNSFCGFLNSLHLLPCMNNTFFEHSHSVLHFILLRDLKKWLETDSMILTSACLLNFIANFPWSAVSVMNLPDSTNTIKYHQGSQDTYTSNTQMIRSALGISCSKRWWLFKQPAIPWSWALRVLLEYTAKDPHLCKNAFLHRTQFPEQPPLLSELFTSYSREWKQPWNVSWIMYLSHVWVILCSGAVQMAARSLTGKTGESVSLCFLESKTKHNYSDKAVLKYCKIHTALLTDMGKFLPALSHFILAS